MEPRSEIDGNWSSEETDRLPGDGSGASDLTALEPDDPVLPPSSQVPSVEELADGVLRKLPDRLVQANRLASIATSLPIGLALSAVALGLAFGGPLDAGIWWIPLPVLTVIWIFLLFRMIRWPAIHHRHLSWSLTPLRIEIGTGVIWQGVTSVPRSRVQHTDVAQGPIQRRFGLATLTIHTAGSDAAQVHLNGLEYEDALVIRDYLILRENNLKPTANVDDVD